MIVLPADGHSAAKLKTMNGGLQNRCDNGQKRLIDGIPVAPLVASTPVFALPTEIESQILVIPKLMLDVNGATMRRVSVGVDVSGLDL